MTNPAQTPVDALIKHGVLNADILHLNSVVTVPRSFELDGHWGLPSRLFRHPISIEANDLRLKHPGLSEHPFVRHLETITGNSIQYLAPKYTDHSLWHHAVDLAMAGMYQELMTTREYTTDENIVGALCFALCHRNDDPMKVLTVKLARQLAKALGCTEPRDRATTIKGLPAPSVVKGECGVRYPVNGIRSGNPEHLYALIHGLEDGWFTHIGDHIQWTAQGRDFHAGESYGLLL